MNIKTQNSNNKSQNINLKADPNSTEVCIQQFVIFDWPYAATIYDQ